MRFTRERRKEIFRFALAGIVLLIIGVLVLGISGEGQGQTVDGLDRSGNNAHMDVVGDPSAVTDTFWGTGSDGLDSSNHLTTTNNLSVIAPDSTEFAFTVVVEWDGTDFSDRTVPLFGLSYPGSDRPLITTALTFDSSNPGPHITMRVITECATQGFDVMSIGFNDFSFQSNDPTVITSAVRNDGGSSTESHLIMKDGGGDNSTTSNDASGGGCFDEATRAWIGEPVDSPDDLITSRPNIEPSQAGVTIYDVRTFVPSADANQGDIRENFHFPVQEAGGREEIGTEETFYTLGNVIPETDSPTLSTTLTPLTEAVPKDLSTEWGGDQEFELAVGLHRGGAPTQSNLIIADQDLELLRSDNQCQEEDFASTSRDAVRFSYDGFVVTDCISENTQGLVSTAVYDRETLEQTGTAKFTACEETPAMSFLDLQTLNYGIFNDLSFNCLHQFNIVTGQSQLRTLGVQDQSAISSFGISHDINNTRFIAASTFDTDPKLHIFNKTVSNKILEIDLEGVGGAAVDIWNQTVYVQEIIDFSTGERNLTKVSFSFNETSEEWEHTFDQRESFSGAATNGIQTSKDGRYLLIEAQDHIELRNASTLTLLKNMTGIDTDDSGGLERVTMDRCNNYVFGLERANGNAVLHRWDVHDVTETDAGSGSPNPCPSLASMGHTEEETVGTPESPTLDEQPEPDEKNPFDAGRIEGLSQANTNLIFGLLALLIFTAGGFSVSQGHAFVTSIFAVGGFIFSVAMGWFPTWVIVFVVLIAAVLLGLIVSGNLPGTQAPQIPFIGERRRGGEE